MKSNLPSEKQTNSDCEFQLSFEGHKVNYFFSGNEHCIVLLHGYLEDHLIWDAIRWQLKDYQLLIPDLPGHGKSELPDGVDWMEFTLSVLTCLLDVKGIPRCTIIGHSMGGYVALEFARRYSDRVVGLGLISTHPFQDSEQKTIRRKKEVDLLTKGRKELLLSAFKNLIEDLTVSRYFEEALKPVDEKCMMAVQKALMKRRDNSLLFESPVWPLFVLYGAEDKGLPLTELEDLLAISPNVMSKCLTEADHYLILNHPDEVVYYIKVLQSV
jgi:pimeloyl-ACP methyl ester carboxylesterase